MIKRFIKKLFFLLVFVLLIYGIFQIYPLADAPGWYFKPNLEHLQPEVYGGEEFVDDYGCLYAGDPNEKRVYLTFDAGYENGNVEKVLNALKAENVKGTFFILPQIIKNNTDLVLRMANEGHLTASHSYSHKNMSNMSFAEFESEITKLENLYTEYTGKKLAGYLRPPEGAFSVKTLENCQKAGIKPVFWSFAYADWDNSKQPSESFALEKIRKHIHPGAVILLHPTSATNAKILPTVIKELKSMGYTFGTVDELKPHREYLRERTDALNNQAFNNIGDCIFSRGNAEKKSVALTFDDGPDSSKTEKILDILDKYGAKATFFTVGEKIAGNEKLIQRMLDSGHEIGNHTFSHPMTGGENADFLKSEIDKTDKILYENFNIKTHLFRPPGGKISEKTAKKLKEEGFLSVLWSVDTEDWKGLSAARILQNIPQSEKELNGAVILFHDCIYGKSDTAKALDSLLAKLTEENYSFLTVSQLADQSEFFK